MALTNITDALKTDLTFFCNSSGDIGTLNGLANLQRALMRRLITVPGTLVHKPKYGVGVLLYENAVSSFDVQQKLATVIQEQFSQDPRVQSVGSVAITSDDETPQLIKIKVFLTPVGYTEQAMTFTPFSEAGPA